MASARTARASTRTPAIIASATRASFPAKTARAASVRSARQRLLGAGEQGGETLWTVGFCLMSFQMPVEEIASRLSAAMASVVTSYQSSSPRRIAVAAPTWARDGATTESVNSAPSPARVG